MMGRCGEMNVSEEHNGDITKEMKIGEGGRGGEESKLERKLVLVEDKEEDKGVIGESGLDWKNVDDGCGLVVEGKEKVEKKNRNKIKDNRK